MRVIGKCVEGMTLAGPDSADLSTPGGKDHGAQRSGPRLWKRSFCASTQDRNKTVSCRSLLRLARAPASGQVRNLRRSRPGRWRPPTHGRRHGGAVKAPGNKSNGFARNPLGLSPFFLAGSGNPLFLLPERGPVPVCWRRWPMARKQPLHTPVDPKGTAASAARH